ncbi:MAG: rhamnulokinase [Anaerolineae bacterium]|nr:rhamnulokinase [Anaerolineae bacterium]
MATTFNLAAIDLGASGGRVMLARFDDDRLMLEEAHRFPNGPVRLFDGLHWDVLRLFGEIKTGLCKAGQTAPLAGLGIDTWGVDFGLLDRDDQLIGNPFHYRDSRTDGVMEQVFALVPRDEVFEHTGIQLMQINSLFQLFAMRQSAALEAARTFLMMPDLLNFWLTGRKTNEYSDATTTQFYNPRAQGYDLGLLAKLGLSTNIYPEIVQPGTQLGPLLPAFSEETGLTKTPVIAPACHDTGCAVAAVPTDNPRAAYISSGTWSLVGVEAVEPVITSQSLAYNFTNEGGVKGTIRLLKNVAGLWLVQECRRIWASQGADYDWEKMTALAGSAQPFGSLVDPDHPDFLNPADMPAAVQAFCSRTGQPVPESHAKILRCIFESLAIKYRWVIECLEEMLGYRLEVIHIIGGGSQNGLLCQLTADVTKRPAVAGPVEATAIGNALVQAISLGHIGSLADGRQLVARSFPLKTYEPHPDDGWEDAFARFRKIAEC